MEWYLLGLVIWAVANHSYRIRGRHFGVEAIRSLLPAGTIRRQSPQIFTTKEFRADMTLGQRVSVITLTLLLVFFCFSPIPRCDWIRVTPQTNTIPPSLLLYLRQSFVVVVMSVVPGMAVDRAASQAVPY